ncbi:MAG: RNA 2',3'-cyclic phosphodiesterase [Sedimentisphaerales bacterium]|nr:RNA 2',3'-cyclic phosphodiesterase [Sedimentisphaerales bacterium]
MSIRCFIAIELDEGIRGELGRLQDRLRRRLQVNDKAVKWVRPENVHLTLKFLGEVADRVIPDICSAVSEAAGEIAPFTFEVTDCGCFPRSGAARVLWVGVKQGKETLLQLQEMVELYLAEIGFPPEERRFSAHLTLGRIKNTEAGRLVHDAVAELEPIRLGCRDVSEITVFQSELTQSGPIYTPLHHGKLMPASTV